MVQEVIKITDENRKNQDKLIAGRPVVKVIVDSAAKYLTVEDKVEEITDTVTLEEMKRSELNEMAEKLELIPTEYKNIGEISAAIREKASEDGKDMSEL